MPGALSDFVMSVCDFSGSLDEEYIIITDRNDGLNQGSATFVTRSASVKYSC